MKLVNQLLPSAGNPRNSEGSFIRLPDGRILFAYSRYVGDSWNDHAFCEIAVIYSSDEGESWTEPRVIASPTDFDAKNLMSVSCIYQNDGRIGIYFIIKENNLTTTCARALSADGESFELSRCRFNLPSSYYVFNNDRLIRLPDGRLAYPAGRHNHGYMPDGSVDIDSSSVSVVLVSNDDGASFELLPFRLTIPTLRQGGVGMQEPGLFVFKDGTVWLWARTSNGFQYESFSRDNLKSFTMPQPSIFSSPASPMEVARDPESDTIYAIYNPISNYPGRPNAKESWGRTPFVIRKSTDEGATWSDVYTLEDVPTRGYCYPALFFTGDGSLLIAYCRGDHGKCLTETGIAKVSLADIR